MRSKRVEGGNIKLHEHKVDTRLFTEEKGHQTKETPSKGQPRTQQHAFLQQPTSFPGLSVEPNPER